MENINKINMVVGEISEPFRIDKYIYWYLEENQNDFPSISRSKIQNLIKNNKVLLNSKISTKNTKVKTGDTIEIEIEAEERPEILAEDIDLDIVYEDEDVLVVNKPRGMVVHPAVGNYTGTMLNGIMYHLKESDYFKLDDSNIRPGIVHRIDKDTTGLLMVAKNEYAHAFLSQQLKERTVNRRYVALVHGGFKDDAGIIDAPIGRDKRDRLKMAVDMRGKNAVTNYKVIERYGKYSLLELKLETGRTHQIRVHMKHIKHPVVGDDLYGSKTCKYRGMGQLLHAKTLGFIHPSTKEYMEFISELPEDFVNVLSTVAPMSSRL